MKNILPLLLLVVTVSACKKKPDPLTPEVPVTKNTNGELRISISHVAGNQALQAGKGWYKTENGDSLQIDRLLYFLSNFKNLLLFFQREFFFFNLRRAEISQILNTISLFFFFWL